MARWGPAMMAVALLVSAVPLIAAACGDGRAVAQPSFSYTERPRLADLSDFALLKERRARVVVHVASAEGLRILIVAEHPLHSHALTRVASRDGAMLPAETVPLQGSPHPSGHETAYALLTTQPVPPGWYRLDLMGEGRIRTLVVETRP